ncbi:hypothetical protein [Streptomyces sp. NRRL S-87]|uniref:DUF6924 domain-containing protein n=1 Tax=Streptomyces sp. NRRL S-87 TaxID=1463920 RepID=UPI000689D1DA|nr:hypothetical protein [Streptomyces sp. NRRL S-87]
MSTLLVRTDFTQPHAWQKLCATLQTPTREGFQADVVTIDDPVYQGLTPEQVLQRAPTDPQDRLIAVADTPALSTPDLPLLVIDLLEEGPQNLRVIAAQLWSIDNNLSLGNMDYEEFAEAADDHGVYRGL